jgi:putative ABC transport system permease protein
MPFPRSIRALAVLSLAAGIGLAAALASVADAILFRPLPVARPSDIVRVFTASGGQPLGFVSYYDYCDLRDASRTLVGIVAQSQVLLAAGGDGSTPARVRLGLAVTPNYFDVLGVRAAFGRTFTAADAREPVVVLSYHFWRATGEPKTIRIASVPFTVIGVAPRNFSLDRFAREDFYLPIEVYATGLLPSAGRPLEDRARRYLTVYGRLAPGSAVPRAQAELSAVAARLEAQHPDTNHGRRAVALTELASRMQSDRTMPSLAAILAAVAALVLAIACANASALMLLRGEMRAHEIAVRLALGLSQWRLLGHLLTESLILAAAGASAAMPVAWVATRILVRAATLPTDLPLALDPKIDGRVIALAAALAALAALVCAIVPWIAARRLDTAALMRTRNSSARNFARNALVAVEIAFALALVASGGYLLQSLAAAGRLDLGYRRDHVLVMAFDPAQTRYTEIQTRSFYRQSVDRVRLLPGVRSAALAQSVPLGLTGAQRQIAIEDQTVPSADRLSVWMNAVSPGYFELMHIRILDGRGFDDRDTAANPAVVVINQELARHWKPGKAVGGRVRISGAGGIVATVVGIAQTVKYFHADEPPKPFFYVPFSQSYASRMVLHVETEGPPAASAPAVLASVREIDAAQPVSDVRTLEDYFSQRAMFGARVALRVVAAVGVAGLALALAGLYGVVANATTRRRREIGIRVAVGASRPGIVVLVLRQHFRLVIAGATGGLGLAVVMSHLLSTLLVASSGRALGPTLAISALLVAAASLAACLVPAWHASGIDPAVALRQE